MHVISFKTTVSYLHVFYDFSCDKTVSIEVFLTTKIVHCYTEHKFDFQIKDLKQIEYFLKFYPAKGIENDDNYSEELISERLLKIKTDIRRFKINDILKSFY